MTQATSPQCQMLRAVNDKSGRMRQARVVAYLRCFLCLTGATQENDENSQPLWSVLRKPRNCISPTTARMSASQAHLLSVGGGGGGGGISSSK